FSDECKLKYFEKEIETMDMEKYITELPMLVKIAIGMYLIAAGLNGLYDLGYMLGKFITLYL
ncbi:MAG: hypothetical protein ACI4V0_01925, partial [Lachnospiraceae bacterium]